MDSTLKVPYMNINKTRACSFFRQGGIYYQLLPKMKEAYASLLMEKFTYYLKQQRLYIRKYGII